MAVADGWLAEDTVNTTATHFYYIEAYLPLGTMFGMIFDRVFFGSFTIPDAYMAVEAGSTIEFIRKPPPTSPPMPEPGSSSSSSTSIIIAVVVVVALVVVAAVVGVVVYMKTTKSKGRRSVTPTKKLVDEEWSRVSPTPPNSAKRHAESIRHF